MRYARVSVTWQVAICGCCLSPVWIAMVHAPRFATGDSPYPNICTEVGVRILSPNKDLCRYKGITLHPAPVPISHSTWYIGPPLAVLNQRGVMCLLEVSLIFFTWKVWIWWNIVCWLSCGTCGPNIMWWSYAGSRTEVWLALTPVSGACKPCTWTCLGSPVVPCLPVLLLQHFNIQNNFVFLSHHALYFQTSCLDLTTPLIFRLFDALVALCESVLILAVLQLLYWESA